MELLGNLSPGMKRLKKENEKVILSLLRDALNMAHGTENLWNTQACHILLAERLDIPQEHSSLETTHNRYGFWKFSSPVTEYILCSRY